MSSTNTTRTMCVQSSRVTDIVEVRGTVGAGVDADPIRAIRRYSTVDGAFVGEVAENEIPIKTRQAGG